MVSISEKAYNQTDGAYPPISGTYSETTQPYLEISGTYPTEEKADLFPATLFHSATTSNSIYIKELQFAGSRRMLAEDYLRGHSIEYGTVLR